MTITTKQITAEQVLGYIEKLKTSNETIVGLQAQLGVTSSFYDTLIGWVYPTVTAQTMRQNMRAKIISPQDLTAKIVARIEQRERARVAKEKRPKMTAEERGKNSFVPRFQAMEKSLREITVRLDALESNVYPKTDPLIRQQTSHVRKFF